MYAPTLYKGIHTGIFQLYKREKERKKEGKKQTDKLQTRLRTENKWLMIISRKKGVSDFYMLKNAKFRVPEVSMPILKLALR